MKLRALVILCLLAPLGAACSDTTDYYFDGIVYDGTTGAALTSYKIALQYLDRDDRATPDKSGRYFIGPLTPFNDYTISITADGYRAFLSQNTMKLDDEQSMNDNTHDDNTHPDRSQDFDAYLYKADLQTTASTLTFSLGDSGDAASGAVTLRPVGTDSPFAAADTGSQVWTNDDDLRAPTVTHDFTNGTLALAGGELVYGVTYAVTVDVSGYAELASTYTAGVEGDAGFVVVKP